ncbi:unnamed protein product [Rotaria socialis]|nr:unnamed protein product [Rotaria socialis]CAF3265970.1 unnamed protein product [Rotaria socialis]CAF3399102.1 unnamed protein product [Rotaria socialis]CAF3779172.1 unnamed protein product [Rotaria socialis]
MNTSEYNKKDISKVFAFLRVQLQTKEKELLDLQLADPCLLSPDSDQVSMLANAINSLQLSTQEGSFVFASASASDDTSYCTNTKSCSTDFNAIKSLPPSVWLSETNRVEQKNQQQSFIFAHLLSLPIDAYLASTSPLLGTTVKTQYRSLCRIPMVNHLLFMPIDAFKVSSKNSMPNKIKMNNNAENNDSSSREKSKSILNDEMMLSKEYWLKKKQNLSSTG